MYVVINDMFKIYVYILYGSGLRLVVKENFDDECNMWYIFFRLFLNE